MERFLGWKGLLIEADPKNVDLLKKKNRKAWLVPTCLSIMPYPIEVRNILVSNICLLRLCRAIQPHTAPHPHAKYFTNYANYI
jgi:hypothetical protein